MSDRQRYTNEAIDQACKALHELAHERGDTRITVDVRADGRVTIEGFGPVWTRWHAEADVLPGGELQYPSAALCDALTVKP